MIPSCNNVHRGAWFQPDEDSPCWRLKNAKIYVFWSVSPNGGLQDVFYMLLSICICMVQFAWSQGVNNVLTTDPKNQRSVPRVDKVLPSDGVNVGRPGHTARASWPDNTSLVDVQSPCWIEKLHSGMGKNNYTLNVFSLTLTDKTGWCFKQCFIFPFASCWKYMLAIIPCL